MHDFPFRNLLYDVKILTCNTGCIVLYCIDCRYFSPRRFVLRCLTKVPEDKLCVTNSERYLIRIKVLQRCKIIFNYNLLITVHDKKIAHPVNFVKFMNEHRNMYIPTCTILLLHCL